jgi:predicted small lipoprotein YifL
MSDLFRRLIVAMLVAGTALPILASCGKKGNLEAPPGEEQTYPRRYPGS